MSEDLNNTSQVDENTETTEENQNSEVQKDAKYYESKIAELEQLREQLKEKDLKIAEVELENGNFKKMIEKNLRKEKILNFIEENNLSNCSNELLNKLAQEEDLEKTCDLLITMNKWVNQARLQDRKQYAKENNYPPGAGRNSDFRGDEKSKGKTRKKGFTEIK